MNKHIVLTIRNETDIVKLAPLVVVADYLERADSYVANITTIFDSLNKSKWYTYKEIGSLLNMPFKTVEGITNNILRIPNKFKRVRRTGAQGRQPVEVNAEGLQLFRLQQQQQAIRKMSTFFKCYQAFVKAGADLLGLETDLAQMPLGDAEKVKKLLLHTIQQTTAHIPEEVTQKIKDYEAAIAEQHNKIERLELLAEEADGWTVEAYLYGVKGWDPEDAKKCKEVAAATTRELHRRGFTELRKIKAVSNDYLACVWQRGILDLYWENRPLPTNTSKEIALQYRYKE